MDKQQAITEIASLVETHKISLSELEAALGRQQIEANKKDVFTLTRVFSYLGGIFILSGIGAFVGTFWELFNSFMRVTITLGPGIVCLILAVLIVAQKKKERTSIVLVVLSAIFQCSGLFVAVVEYTPGGGDPRLAAFLICGVLAAQYLLIFSRFKLTSLLFFSISFAIAAFVSVASLLKIPNDLIEFIAGGSVFALSYGINRTPYNSICGFGYFVSSVTLLWLGFDLVRDSWIEISYLGMAAFMLYVSTIVKSRLVLFPSIMGIFSYITYFTEKHFADSLGWPLCLILLGFVFFGLSNAALKLNKRIAA